MYRTSRTNTHTHIHTHKTITSFFSSTASHLLLFSLHSTLKQTLPIKTKARGKIHTGEKRVEKKIEKKAKRREERKKEREEEKGRKIKSLRGFFILFFLKECSSQTP